jgi:hypothetical protein
MTHCARRNIVTELARLEAKGHKAEDVLNQSVTRCWTGVFEVAQPFPSFARSARDAPPRDVGASWTEEAIAAREAKLAEDEERDYCMWQGMKPEYKQQHPWRGKVFDEVPA